MSSLKFKFIQPHFTAKVNGRLDPLGPEFTERKLLYLFSQYKSGYYGGTDVLAHELLGHGFDASNGDFGDNQNAAIGIANDLRELIGKPRRGGWFGSDTPCGCE